MEEEIVLIDLDSDVEEETESKCKLTVQEENRNKSELNDQNPSTSGRNKFEINQYNENNRHLSSKLLQQFLDICTRNEDGFCWKKSKIKIWKLYDNLDSKYIISENFVHFLKYQLQIVQNNKNETLQTVIHLKDDLKNHQSLELKDKGEITYKLKKIRKLETVLYKLHRYIKKYENYELDFSKDEDWDENSTYIKQERFRERFVKVYKKLCSLKNEPEVRGISIYHVEIDQTPHRELNEEIEKTILKNKKYPDFRDIYNLIEEHNKKLKLKLSSSLIQLYAEKIFKNIGLQIKRRRCFQFYQNMGSYCEDQIEKDPADLDQELAKRLEHNGKIFQDKMNSICEKYTKAQIAKKIIPEVIPDDIPSSENDDSEIEEMNETENDDKENEDNDEENLEKSDNESEEKNHNKVPKIKENNNDSKENEIKNKNNNINIVEYDGDEKLDEIEEIIFIQDKSEVNLNNEVPGFTKIDEINEKFLNNDKTVECDPLEIHQSSSNNNSIPIKIISKSRSTNSFKKIDLSKNYKEIKTKNEFQTNSTFKGKRSISPPIETAKRLKKSEDDDNDIIFLD